MMGVGSNPFVKILSLTQSRLSSSPFVLDIILGLNEFFQNLMLSLSFHQTAGPPPIRWIHNDSMYVSFCGIRKSKSTLRMKMG